MKKKQRNNKKARPLNLVPVFRSIILGVISLIVLGLFYWASRLFSVQSVECQLQAGTNCPTELNETLVSLINKPMFFTNYEQVLQDTQALTQPYSLVSTSKKLPNQLTLAFAAEKPLVLLRHADSLHVISRSGRAFPQTDDSNPAMSQLLQLETDQSLLSDNAMDPDSLTTIKLIADTIDEYSLPINKITWLDKTTIKLSMKDRPEIAVIDSESPRLELQRLSLILQSKEYEALSEPKNELDLRFTMPVLRTEP